MQFSVFRDYILWYFVTNTIVMNIENSQIWSTCVYISRFSFRKSIWWCLYIFMKIFMKARGWPGSLVVVVWRHAASLFSVVVYLHFPCTLREVMQYALFRVFQPGDNKRSHHVRTIPLRRFIETWKEARKSVLLLDGKIQRNIYIQPGNHNSRWWPWFYVIPCLIKLLFVFI